MDWPESVNETWNYWNQWAGADFTRQVRNYFVKAQRLFSISNF